jgi:hypothetical protein
MFLKLHNIQYNTNNTIAAVNDCYHYVPRLLTPCITFHTIHTTWTPLWMLVYHYVLRLSTPWHSIQYRQHERRCECLYIITFLGFQPHNIQYNTDNMNTAVNACTSLCSSAFNPITFNTMQTAWTPLWMLVYHYVPRLSTPWHSIQYRQHEHRCECLYIITFRGFQPHDIQYNTYNMNAAVNASTSLRSSAFNPMTFNTIHTTWTPLWTSVHHYVPRLSTPWHSIHYRQHERRCECLYIITFLSFQPHDIQYNTDSVNAAVDACISLRLRFSWTP